MQQSKASVLSINCDHVTGLSVSEIYVQKVSHAGALSLLIVFSLLSMCSYEAVFIMALAHSLNPGVVGVYQCLRIVLAATVMPTMMTENSLLDMLHSWLLSPSRQSLGETGIFLPAHLPRYSKTNLQKGWIDGHYQIQCDKVPPSFWHFQHKLLFITPIHKMGVMNGVK